MDLLIRRPYTNEDGRRAVQREAVELKVWRRARQDPLTEGLSQLDDYLHRLDLDEGTLVIFDRRPDAPPIDQRTAFGTAQTPSGKKVVLLRA